MKELSENEILARLIRSTRRHKRDYNLVEVVDYMNKLIKIYGDKKKVAETLGIGLGTLNRFLSINKFSPNVKKYFKEKALQSFTIAHSIVRFPEKEQLEIIKKVMNGEINTQDVKVLSPLRKNYKNFTINQLINKVKKSKNKKIYVYYFKIPDGITTNKEFKSVINKLLKDEDIIKADINGRLGILKLSERGKKIINEESKTKHISLNNYIKSLFENE